jgi:hypothetical protein
MKAIKSKINVDVISLHKLIKSNGYKLEFGDVLACLTAELPQLRVYSYMMPVSDFIDIVFGLHKSGQMHPGKDWQREFIRLAADLHADESASDADILIAGWDGGI